MITGWIWLDENKTFNTAKCLKKVLIPLFSFGYVYALMELVYAERKVTLPILFKAFGNILSDKLWTHMWYLYMLAGIYLVIPALKLLLRNLDDKQQQYLLAVLTVFTILFPTLRIMTGFEVGFYLPVQTPYLLYLLLGHYLAKRPIPVKYAAVNLLCAHMFLFLSVFILDGDLGYAHFAILWMSGAYFILAVSLQPACEKIDGAVLSYIGRKTFGIYILHALFINVIYKVVKFDPFVLPNGANWLLLTAGVFILSFLTTVIIQKIPIINKIFCI